MKRADLVRISPDARRFGFTSAQRLIIGENGGLVRFPELVKFALCYSQHAVLIRCALTSRSNLDYFVLQKPFVTQ
jgi:hypothetical protein